MYNYIPVKTIFTATLWLHYMAHVMLFPMINDLCILHYYFPKYVCSAKHGCRLQFLNVLLSMFVAQVLSE